MPLRINWTRGRFLGILLLYVGFMGFSQSLIIIPISQYLFSVGSLYVITLIPIGVTAALTYCSQIIYEVNSRSSMSTKRTTSSSSQKEIMGINYKVFGPIISTIIVFMLLFFTVFTLGQSSWEVTNAFIVAENVGAIGCLIYASILDSSGGKK